MLKNMRSVILHNISGNTVARQPHFRSGFTLVELSIVLVILGLLVGGVLAGQNLIRAAELRSVTSEYRGYITAVHTFRNKYFAIPGDMTNAEKFWGTMATGTCPNATAGTGTQTCNGDGDGIIQNASAASRTGETFTFWQHLANAELVAGTYTGIAGSGSSYAANANNTPNSKLDNAYWYIFNWNTSFTGSGSVFDGTYTDNLFQFGALSTSSSNSVSVLSPEELWNIDKKIDDGKPAYGLVRERNWSSCTTAANSADLSADYLLSASGAACTPIFTVQ